MKKIIFITLSVLSLISCSDIQIKQDVSPFSKWHYKGHYYICFGNYGNTYGVVHDPDCPCHLDTLGIYVVENNDTTYVIKKK